MTVRIKSIALPPEHGSWGFLFEPILLGLLIAPSWAGLGIALGVTGAFLARQPVKIALVDWQRRKRYARTRAAEKFAAVYSLLSLAGFALAAVLVGFDPLLPFLLGIPLGIVVILSYARNQGRALFPELAGATALALSATSIALAGGKNWELALVLWAVQTARNIPSILFIRARLRLDKGQPTNLLPARLANALAVVGVVLLVIFSVGPILSLAAISILALRALRGLSASRQQVRVAVIGMLELFYGVLTVALTALGYALGI